MGDRDKFIEYMRTAGLMENITSKLKMLQIRKSLSMIQQKQNLQIIFQFLSPQEVFQTCRIICKFAVDTIRFHTSFDLCQIFKSIEKYPGNVDIKNFNKKLFFNICKHLQHVQIFNQYYHIYKTNLSNITQNLTNLVSLTIYSFTINGFLLIKQNCKTLKSLEIFS